MTIGFNSTGNYYQSLNNKYGVGYEDFGSRPYIRKYPMPITPEPIKPPVKNWVQRFVNKLFF